MATYLELDGASGTYVRTPDDPVLDITGDIDLRVDCALDDWTPAAQVTLIAKYETGTPQRSYRLYIGTNGRPALQFSADGTNALAAGANADWSPVDGGRYVIRATLDVDNGSSGRTANFYVSNNIAGPWLTIGTAVTAAGTTSLYDGTAELSIGGHNLGTANQMTGKVWQAQVRDGIDGTIVAWPIFSAWTKEQTSFTDQTGRAWTVAGTAAIVDDGATPLSEQDLNKLSQEKYGVDLNRGLQLASGIRKDKNGVAHTLWGGREAHSRRAQIQSLLEGGGVAEESAPPNAGMSLVFFDDFDEWDQTRWVPHPWQVDRFPADGVTCEDSILKLSVTDEMDPEPPSCSLTSLGLRDDDGPPYYPDAGAWQEGYFECRMRFTDHIDAYPAFWMLAAHRPNLWEPGDGTGVQEKECPIPRFEWDIVEQVNNPDTIAHTAAHTSNVEMCDYPDESWGDAAPAPAGVKLSDWHVWGGLWKDGYLTQYLDGVPMSKIPAPETLELGPMYLVLMCDRRDVFTNLPVMEVWFDWVKVWQ